MSKLKSTGSHFFCSHEVTQMCTKKATERECMFVCAVRIHYSSHPPPRLHGTFVPCGTTVGSDAGNLSTVLWYVCVWGGCTICAGKLFG